MADRITGVIWAFDLGMAACGFAHGRPGEKPVSGVIRLKRSSEPPDVAFWNLILFLNERWHDERPAYVVKERMLALQAFLEMGNGEAVPKSHAALHGIVEAMCRGFDVPWVDISDSTVRKHFIGVGRMGTRRETKAAVVQRCHVLGLMPREVMDDNRADALATHDYACSTLGRRSTSMSRLVFFNETEGATDVR
jgi:hypothetical protein